MANKVSEYFKHKELGKKQKRNSNISSEDSNFFIKSSTRDQRLKLNSPAARKCPNKQGTHFIDFENKRTFDKKEYRFQVYSKKCKLKEWERKRKKTIFREYCQTLKNEHQPQMTVEYGEEKPIVITNHNELDRSQYKKNKRPFLKPHELYKEIQEEKRRKLEGLQRQKEEREISIQEARRERCNRTKMLSQKTKKGQPFMKYRIEMLLKNIEKSIKQ